MLNFTAAIEVLKERPVLDHGAPITPVEGGADVEGKTRSECARTGEPLIDGVLRVPVVRRNIDEPIVDRTYDTPYGAGASEPWEDQTLFLDRHAPARMEAKRQSESGFVSFDPAEPWAVHENVEQAVMEMLIAAGMDEPVAYKCAHFGWAEVAEGAWYECHDINRDDAEEKEKVWLQEVQHEDPEHPAPGLYVRTYPRHDVYLARGEPYEEPKPTPEQMAEARRIIAGTLGIEDPLAKADSITGTLYVRRQVLNAEDLIEWAQNEGFSTTLQPGDLHVTVLFSKAEMEWPAPADDAGMIIEDGERAVVMFGEAAVLLFEAPELSRRHDEFVAAGGSHDYPQYHPHVTISYNTGELDEADIRPYPGRIELGPEIFESVKEGWAEGTTEKMDKAFNEDQPRDEHGRWTGGGGAPEAGAQPTWLDAEGGSDVSTHGYDAASELSGHSDEINSATDELDQKSSEADEVSGREDDIINEFGSESPEYKAWEKENETAGKAVAEAASDLRTKLAEHVDKAHAALAKLDAKLAEHAKSYG